jgi:hypothetical protein
MRTFSEVWTRFLKPPRLFPWQNAEITQCAWIIDPTLLFPALMEDVLSPELRLALGLGEDDYGARSAADTVMPSKRKKRSNADKKDRRPPVELSRAERRQSKSQQRKLAKLEAGSVDFVVTNSRCWVAIDRRRSAKKRHVDHRCSLRSQSRP